MLEILAFLIIIALIYDFLKTYGGILLCSIICLSIVVIFYHYRKQKIAKRNAEQSRQLFNTDEKEPTESITCFKESSSIMEDYAKTIFLYHVRISPIKTQEKYPKYFQDYPIGNAPQYHQALIQEGYLAEAPLKEQLQSLKLPELKAILTEQSLTKSGKKEVLIQRILDNAEKIDFEKYFPQKIYSLTEKGSAFLQEHEDYIRLNKHGDWGIDVQEYEAKRRPGYSFYDTVWRILNERVSPNSDWGRNEYFFMYQLLAEEGRRKAALGQLLRVLYLDVNGIDFLYDIRLFQNGEETLHQIQDLLTSTNGLAPGVIDAIASYKDVYDDKMIAELYKWNIPVQLCSQELFLSLVHSVLDDTYDEDVYTNKLKAEYRQKLSEMKHK